MTLAEQRKYERKRTPVRSKLWAPQLTGLRDGGSGLAGGAGEEAELEA